MAHMVAIMKGMTSGKPFLVVEDDVILGGNGSSPLTPPCPFRKLPILESDWELVCNNNSPNNRHNIAKLFYQ